MRSVLLACCAAAFAPCARADAGVATPGAAAELRAAIEAQARQLQDREEALARQQAELAAQRRDIEQLRARLEALEALEAAEAAGAAGASEAREAREPAAAAPAPSPAPPLVPTSSAPPGAAEEASQPPELPSVEVGVTDFPNSLRIPGTDTAIRFGGQIRAASVFTLSPLGSDDRFLTHSIPTDDAPVAGGGRRTTMSAAGSRFNVDVRTPAGREHVKTFLEGDFAGAGDTFRLRHAYAQFRGAVVGQTWTTFSDPEARPEDLDFEGVSSENLVRQTQIRWEWRRDRRVQVAAAAEFPRVSLTGGQGVNLVPDLVVRLHWRRGERRHLQVAGVLRALRGESALAPDEVAEATGWGLSVSGAFPFLVRGLRDRVVFQLNAGEGIGRYVNDLNKLGGQDAIFDPATGDLEPLRVLGWYVDYEHAWTRWEAGRRLNLHSSFIWSHVTVDNESFQGDDAYHRTERFSGNLIFSPVPRVDVGAEYIRGTREDKDGARGWAHQLQVVGLFRF